MSDKSPTTAVVGVRWTPRTLVEACMYIRSLEAEREAFRQDVTMFRDVVLSIANQDSSERTRCAALRLAVRAFDEGVKLA